MEYDFIKSRLSINPVKIIINFSLFKYEAKVICSIYHFVIELLNSSSQVFYQHEWLNSVTANGERHTSSGHDHLKDCYLPNKHSFLLHLEKILFQYGSRFKGKNITDNI